MKQELLKRQSAHKKARIDKRNAPIVKKVETPVATESTESAPEESAEN